MGDQGRPEQPQFDGLLDATDMQRQGNDRCYVSPQAEAAAKAQVRRKSKSDKPSKYVGWGAVRPRINLLQGKGDPGPAGKDPLGGTEPSASPSTSSPSGEAEKDDGKAPDKDTVDTAASASDDDSDLWIYLGVGAVAAAVLTGAAVVIRRSRRT